MRRRLLSLLVCMLAVYGVAYSQNISSVRLVALNGSTFNYANIDGSGNLLTASGTATPVAVSGYIPPMAMTALNTTTGKFEYVHIDSNGNILTTGGISSSIVLKTNGTNNGSQSILNLKNGSNITMVDDGIGGVTLNASGTGGATLKTNGTNNGSQTILNLKNGGATTIADDGVGGITITSPAQAYPGAGIGVSTGSAWGSSLVAPTGTIVGTTDTQTLTGKTVDGVTPTIMGFVDPTSSIQTQLNSKQASGTYLTSISIASANGITGSSSGGATPSLTLVLGAITPASVSATGAVSSGATPPTACGSATGCYAATEASTTGTPTSGQAFIRADSTSHTYKVSVNGSAEASMLLAGTNSRRTCDIPIGDTSASALTSGQLGPQSRICYIPAASTIVELDVNADAGTPNIIVGRNHAGTVVNVVSVALATAASGGIACSNTGGTTGLNGATTCSSTLQNTALSAGDYLELVSGTPGGTAKLMVAHVVYTVN